MTGALAGVSADRSLDDATLETLRAVGDGRRRLVYCPACTCRFVAPTDREPGLVRCPCGYLRGMEWLRTDLWCRLGTMLPNAAAIDAALALRTITAEVATQLQDPPVGELFKLGWLS